MRAFHNPPLPSRERGNPAGRFATGPRGFDRRAIERVAPIAQQWEGEGEARPALSPLTPTLSRKGRGGRVGAWAPCTS